MLWRQTGNRSDLLLDDYVQCATLRQRCVRRVDVIREREGLRSLEGIERDV